ncbi:TIGR02186 family protein [Albidovulum sp.]
MLRALAILLALLPLGAAAQEDVVAGMSQNRIAITANFDGSEILIFGAVKRESPPPVDSRLGVIITVAGPSRPLVVRRKERRMGIWVNVDAVEIDLAPSFYAVATSAPWSEVISDTSDLRHKISIPRAIRSVGAPMTIKDSLSFTEALIRIRTREGLYQLKENSVTLSQDTLFDTSIALPSNLTEGLYKTRIFLTRNGRVIDSYETGIEVRKVGLERFLYTLAHEQPLIYGLMSLAIAIAAGWIASGVFRYFRR